MNQIPTGWEMCLLVDLLAPLGDGRLLHQGWSPQCDSVPSEDNGTWAVLKTTAIQDGAFLPEHNKRLPKKLEPRPNIEVRNGDILLTCAGPRARCGVPCLVRSTRPKLMISGKMYRMRVDDQHIDPRFIEAILRSPDVQKFIDGLKTGINESGMNLTHDRFSKLEIPLPPTAEQRLIADKLDALFERSRNIRDKLDRAPAILAKLRKSILAAAMGASSTGRKVGLQELCKPDRALTYGIIKLGNHVADGVPVLRSSNVRHLRLDTENIKKVDPALSREYSRTVLSGNEVLITVRGTLGGVCAVGPEHVGWNVSREVAAIPLVDEVNADYVAMAIASPQSQQWLRKAYKGVAYTGINIADLKNLSIALPSRAEQDAVVSTVRGALKSVESIAGVVESSNGKVSLTERAFLSKAFRGELVPQDPSDEPAAALLERILAKRNTRPAAKRTRKTRTTMRTV